VSKPSDDDPCVEESLTPGGHEARARAEIQEGISLIHEGRALVEDEQREEAYTKYVEGLSRLLKVDKTSRQFLEMQSQITDYVEEAEKLKDSLDADAADK